MRVARVGRAGEGEGRGQGLVGGEDLVRGFFVRGQFLDQFEDYWDICCRFVVSRSLVFGGLLWDSEP